MSKLRRLLLCSALLAGIVLLGAQALGMLTAHRHLSRQLAQQSESGARTLAWVLGRAPSTPHEREVLADELYSQGLYARIRIADEASGDSVDRGPDATTDATTDASSGAWLERWFSLRAPAVSLPYASPDGARAHGHRQGDATLANDTLWQGGVRAVGLALSAGLFWALFAISLARRIETSASRDISQRVRALAPGADASPSGSCGLESVDQALVDARRRVDATVEEQNARIESLQSEIHRDAVTWLPNRKYFMDRFRAALSDRTAEAGGHLLMFRQRDLAQINRHLSRAFTDQWLRSSADRLRRLVDAQGGSQALLARIGGSDFALLMPRSSAPQAGVLAERVRRELRSLRVPMGKHGWCRWALAMAEFAPGDGMSDTLARLDHALMCSESADDDQVAPASQAADSTRIGEYSWHDALTTALEQHKFALAVQALQDVSGGLLHHEASLTLHDASGADPVPASIFMPPAVRLGLSAECDIQALRLGLDWLYAQHGALAAPVALGSLSQPGFLARLERCSATGPPSPGG